MASSDRPADYRTVARDTIQLKKKLDDVLCCFAERIEKAVKETGRLTEADLEIAVDEISAEIVVPTAQYVKRQLRRKGISCDEFFGVKVADDAEDEEPATPGA